MCECREELEEKLLKRFIEQYPDAQDHQVQLKGYSYCVNGNSFLQVGVMPFEMVAKHPLRKGGLKSKKMTQSMVFTFCPFCGEKYKDD